jgi:hypothetical protein
MKMTGNTATSRIEELGRQVSHQQYEQRHAVPATQGGASGMFSGWSNQPILLGLAGIALGGLIAVCLMRR